MLETIPARSKAEKQRYLAAGWEASNCLDNTHHGHHCVALMCRLTLDDPEAGRGEEA